MTDKFSRLQVTYTRESCTGCSESIRLQRVGNPSIKQEELPIRCNDCGQINLISDPHVTRL